MHLDETALYADLSSATGEGFRLQLDEDERAHLRVLRLSSGDTLQLLDGRGGSTIAALMSPKEGTVQLLQPIEHHPRPVAPSLALAILKSKDLEELFDHASQTALAAFQPLWSDYTQFSRKASAFEGTLRRLRIKAKVALKQSRQYWMTDVHPPVALQSWLTTATEIISLDIAGESAQKLSINAQSWLLCGPEGGFSPQEEEWIASHPHAKRMSLGSTRLRARTAPLFALGALLGIATSDPI